MSGDRSSGRQRPRHGNCGGRSDGSRSRERLTTDGCGGSRREVAGMERGGRSKTDFETV
jgi:hypothetical protein